jgi:hypothetical protein
VPLDFVELNRCELENLTAPAELFDCLETILFEELINAFEIEGDSVRIYLNKNKRIDAALLAESLTRRPEPKLTNSERRPSALKKGRGNA